MTWKASFALLCHFSSCHYTTVLIPSEDKSNGYARMTFFISYQGKQIGFNVSRPLLTRRHESGMDAWYFMLLARYILYLLSVSVCDCDVTLLWCQSPMLEVVAPSPRANKKVLSLRIFKVLLATTLLLLCKLQATNKMYFCLPKLWLRRQFFNKKELL